MNEIKRMNVMDELEMSKYQKDRNQVTEGFINNLITSIKLKIKSGALALGMKNLYQYCIIR